MSASSVAVESPFPLLPLRNGVLLPHTTTTLAIGRPRSLALLKDCKAGSSIIGVAIQKDPQILNPELEDLHPVGVFARVTAVQQHGNKTVMLSLQGLERFTIKSLVDENPYWLAESEPFPSFSSDPTEAEFLAESLRKQIAENDKELASHLGKISDDESPGRVADRVAAALGAPIPNILEVLFMENVNDRLRLVISLVGKAQAVRDLRKKIDLEVRKELNKNQKEMVLREQLKAIKKELGEKNNVDALKEQLDKADLPDFVREVAEAEWSRLESMNSAHAESNTIRNYLEWILALPWSCEADVESHIPKVEAQLNADHFGLKDPKERILEHLAVMKMADNPKGTILCFVGPPGVGKTSLGKSIAEATGRPFARISLGGVRDEAEIRGHRRTYVGARPGRIINALKKVAVKNPLILLDEVDKLGVSWQGSPESALLEVLDPEQNNSFTDHYMELPFDLSQVLFICTANSLSEISAPLRDRLEIVEVSSYTQEEKLEIAKRHLLPKQLENHGLDEAIMKLEDDAISRIIAEYTREAGVRQLNRELIRLSRKITLKIAQNEEASHQRFVVNAANLPDYLGTPKFRETMKESKPQIGVATGLAWTQVGGDILFIEATRMPGKGQLQITGKLGEVMTESAKAALSYVRSHANRLGIDPSVFETSDIHIHVPEGGVPKDGPSAGVTMFTALTSLLSQRNVRTDTAMTGEATLRGRVLPVGGIKEKVLAANRAGIFRIVLPKDNERQLEELPVEAKNKTTFILVEDMEEVLSVVLEDSPILEVEALLSIESPLDESTNPGSP